MSGGYFNLNGIKEIIDHLKHIIKNKDYFNYLNPNTLEELEKGLKAITIAYVYAKRIDWFLEDDDGEETFHERLKEELEEIK